ncbi:MAG: anaphase-promoting complex subunit cdc27 [Stictis urceolatum]|nr:anaphase-promoting complex subunit cdc27 [Stictis urceolata]
MSPVNHHIIHQLRYLVFYNIDCNLPRNALFFAGRLHAYEPRSSEAAYLLALCYLRLEQYKSAYDYSKNSGLRGTHLGCAYVFAQSCLALGKHPEGILALERSKGLWSARNNWNKHSESRRQHLPDAAAVYSLQGKLLHSFQDLNKAIEAYVEALKLNPFMWDAFLALSDLGATVKVQNIFKITPEMASVLASGTAEETSLGILGGDESGQQPETSSVPVQPAANDPFSISTNRVNDNRLNLGKHALFEKLNGSSILVPPIGDHNSVYEGTETPTAPAATFVSQMPKVKEHSTTMVDYSVVNEPPHAPARKARPLPSVDLGAEAPPRMKTSSLRAKSRVNGDFEEAEVIGTTVPSSITDRKRTASGRTTESTQINGPSDPSAPQRRSARLFSQFSRPQTNNKFAAAANTSSLREGREIKKVKSTTATKTRPQGTVGRVVSGNRKHIDTFETDKEHRPLSSTATIPPAQVKSNNHGKAANEKAKGEEALQALLELFTKLGSGYLALSNYRCHEAINIFSSITSTQRETPWVLAQMGRALYEQASYTEAEKYFARIRILAPSHLEDMELYSTVLWHLKNDIDLAHLAHELVGFDRLSPQAWIAVGNSFSLQRDHDQALKCFKRATQLDPTFAYAFTLQGHEHVYNEEYGKAMVAFRSGIIADHRHYNSWYGLARVYEKQGKFEVAEQHYRTAASINPTSSVLLCCIGMVLEKQRRPMLALDLYTQSIELAPRSTLALFKRARVLTQLGHNEQALGVLNDLKNIAPDEANVHFLLGRVSKNLRRKGEAIKHFTTALNLDPKASGYIKEAMEQMEDDEDDEDGYMA